MTAQINIRAFEGKSATFHFDIASSAAKLEFGRHYEDEVEAEFFGDHIPEGAPAGVRFDGVRDYRSSADDHVHVGRLEIASFTAANCSLRFTAKEAEASSDVGFSFERATPLVSVRKTKDAS